MRPYALFLASLLAAAGCGDDPISYSTPVGINLKAKGGDVKNGVITDEKGITTETNNPFGEFVKEARARLGGVDPGHIALEQLTLTLGGKSKGVLGLEEVYAGAVDVLFVMNDTDNTFNVGTLADPHGAGPLALSITFDDQLLGPTDWDKFLSGSFKVVIRGAALPAFDGADAEADLLLTFGFVAYE